MPLASCFRLAVDARIFTNRDLFICARNSKGQSRGIIIFHSPSAPLVSLPDVRLFFKYQSPSDLVASLKRMKDCTECAFSGDPLLMEEFTKAPLLFRLLVTAQAYDADEGLPSFMGMKIDNPQQKKIALNVHSGPCSDEPNEEPSDASTPAALPDSRASLQTPVPMDAVFAQYLAEPAP